MIFALIGNQNCGKTTLFNQLTGSNQHVGNFPGVTVEGKTGIINRIKNNPPEIIDLPGLYSLSPYTGEETVARDCLTSGKIDAVINIIDAGNIERNLYLTMQLREYGLPMIIALNMMDEVRKNGGAVDAAGLAKELGVAVVPISASKNEGVTELVEKAIEAAKAKKPPRFPHTEAENLFSCRTQSAKEEESFDAYCAAAVKKYKFIEYLCEKYVKKPAESTEQKRSQKIDKILTHKYFGLPIFFGIMFAVFWLTFGVFGKYLSELLLFGIDSLGAAVDNIFAAYNLNAVARSLVIDGIFTGVGTVLSFLPIIIVLFFFLSLLEDSGYMARVAFIIDRPLKKLGLSGKSLVPMLIGFGCTVPAVMSTRTLSSERDRKMTVFLLPFFSCSAKLPVYAVFCAAFFPRFAPLVMIALYVLGILTAVIAALIMKKTSFKGEDAPFVMELPNYRMPSAKTTLLLMWDKAKDFLKRAFTMILIAALVVWFLQTFDFRLNALVGNADRSASMLASLGKLLAPVFSPLGFGNWQSVTALIAGFTAKEAVVSTLAVLTGTTAGSVSAALGALFSPPAALAFLVFTLFYTPCIAAVRAVRTELGAKSASVLVFTQCAFAYVAAALVYQIGSLF